MKRPLIVCFALVALVSALAGTYKIPPEEPFATIDFPDKWQIKEHPEAIEASSPDGSVFFIISSVEHNKVAEAIGETMQYMRNRDYIVVKGESRHDEDGKVNATPAHFVSWQGKNKNGEIEMKFAVITLANNQSLVAAYDGSPIANKKHQRELDKTLQSIKKIQSPDGAASPAEKD